MLDDWRLSHIYLAMVSKIGFPRGFFSQQKTLVFACFQGQLSLRWRWDLRNPLVLLWLRKCLSTPFLCDAVSLRNPAWQAWRHAWQAWLRSRLVLPYQWPAPESQVTSSKIQGMLQEPCHISNIWFFCIVMFGASWVLIIHSAIVLMFFGVLPCHWDPTGV